MRLCASNIAWTSEQDEAVYQLMNASGFEGLEIAPSRLFPDKPYDHLSDAAEFAEYVRKVYGLTVASMQSLWYGMPQRIAGTQRERSELLEYTVKALHFADALDCRNIVFGCPKNRRLERPEDVSIVEEFIAKIAEEAGKFGIVIALEANPEIYGTNFVNTTSEAIALVTRINHPFLKVNLDVGTMLANRENPDTLAEKVSAINHVHISEPELAAVKPHKEHEILSRLLKESGYDGFVSIEMRKCESLSELERAINHVRRIFA
ncbi:MAG: sugar phosphate isomerase/epimerase [Synergistaceae bacterium]|nr:sugar phosphate isomerase/epimerase [Synergistaceae bacterium]